MDFFCGKISKRGHNTSFVFWNFFSTIFVEKYLHFPKITRMFQVPTNYSTNRQSNKFNDNSNYVPGKPLCFPAHSSPNRLSICYSIFNSFILFYFMVCLPFYGDWPCVLASTPRRNMAKISVFTNFNFIFSGIVLNLVWLSCKCSIVSQNLLFSRSSKTILNIFSVNRSVSPHIPQTYPFSLCCLPLRNWVIT